MREHHYNQPGPPGSGARVMPARDGGPGWGPLLLVALVVPLLCALGFWQISRAQEKAALVADYADKASRAPVDADALHGLGAAQLAYLPVRLTGRFHAEHVFLLDNRVRDGRFGNEVIALFLPAGGGTAFLVNRGWVPADPARRALPRVPPAPGTLTVRGHVYVAPGASLVLGEQRLRAGWPKQVQSLDLPQLRAALNLSEGALFPYVVRLAEDSPGALRPGWPVVNISAGKHVGYAVQWFAMAVALALYALWRSRQQAAWRHSAGKLSAGRHPAGPPDDQGG